MADDNEDSSLLQSMKEAIAKEKEAEQPAEAEEEKVEEVKEEDEETSDENSDKEEVEEAEEDEEPTRGQSRHQKLANQLKEERAEREKERKEKEQLIADKATYAARLEEIEKRQQAGQSDAQRRAEEDRLALLDPTERAAYQANQKAQNLEYRLNQMESQRQDDVDRAEFRSKASSDPLVEKYKDQVEAMRQQDLKRGFVASRDSYLNFIVGEAIRKDASKKLSSKKEAAGKRVDSVTSKSASARGDVKGSKKLDPDSLEALEERLRGRII